jgi:DDE superfamily endonuclease
LQARPLLFASRYSYPAERYTRLYVVVDNYSIHHAKAVEQWLAAHPRVTLLWLPTDCPHANPIERAFGDVHDLCTRDHTRRRLRDLVADVETHLQVNGPWYYKLSAVYYEPDGTAAVENIAAEEQTKVAA